MGAVFFVETNTSEKSELICKIAEYSYSLSNPIHIVTDTQNDAIRLNALLWTFEANSFVPHRICQSAEDTCAETVKITPHPFKVDNCETVIFENQFHKDLVPNYTRNIHFVLLDNQDKRRNSRDLWTSLKANKVPIYHTAYRPLNEFGFTIKILALFDMADQHYNAGDGQR